MLRITRRAGERIIVGDDIVITLLEVSGSTARIGVEAPAEVPIFREELWEEIRRENEAAASATGVLPALPDAPADPSRQADVTVVTPTE